MRRMLLLTVGGVLLALVGAPDAGATVKGIGWWSDVPTASAPEGGISIGANPSGPSAVAAVLLDLEDGASRGSLTLHQSGGAAPAGAAIVACVVGSFTPVEHGPMAEAPATACETTSTPVKVSGDGVTWSADITDLLGDKRGRVGVALVPAPGASLFDLQFDTVSATVSPAAGGSSSSSGGRSTVTTTAPSSSSSPVPSSSTPAPRPATGSFSPPSAPSVAAPGASTATTVAASVGGEAAMDAASDATEVAAGGSVALPTAESTGVTSEPSGSASQALGYVLLAAILGVVGGVGHRFASKRFSAA